jgi:hypothetical protein
VNLATFVDYNFTSPSQPVVLQIGTGLGSYCLTYNRAKGVNYQTEAAPNQVTVAVSAPGSMKTQLDIIDETTPPYTETNYTSLPKSNCRQRRLRNCRHWLELGRLWSASQ